MKIKLTVFVTSSIVMQFFFIQKCWITDLGAQKAQYFLCNFSEVLAKQCDGAVY